MCGGVGALFAVAEAHHFVLLFFLKGAFFSSLFFLFYLKKKASSLESPFISRPTNVCRHNVQLRGTRKWIGGREMEEKTTKVPFYFSYVQTESGLFFLLLLCNWLTRNCVTRKFLRTNVASLFSRSFDLFLIANGKNCWNERLRPFHRDLKSADSAWLAYHNQTKRNVCPSLCPIKRKKNYYYFFFNSEMLFGRWQDGGGTCLFSFIPLDWTEHVYTIDPLVIVSRPDASLFILAPVNKENSGFSFSSSSLF